ncbi:hypothetical protein Cni_G13960 [Canna indica]|uniref:Uncharacterized protein n=1 Tax=Canna indica TaxID=4628 RepID=A0AAQ3QDI6_9LILI|nr:hypothetical protein Cni_G13960 [Canna indica]
MSSRGGTITRLKQHLAVGYPDVTKCPKAPVERVWDAEQRAEFNRRDTQDVSQYEGRQYEARGGGADEDSDLEAVIRASLEQEAFERDQKYYFDSQFEYGRGSGSGGTSSVDSTSATGAMNQSGSIPSCPHIGQSSSKRVLSQSKGGGSRGRGIRGFFTNIVPNGRKFSVDLIDLDPRTYPPQTSKQPRIDDS